MEAPLDLASRLPTPHTYWIDFVAARDGREVTVPSLYIEARTVLE